jgi:hypothetical protein
MRFFTCVGGNDANPGGSERVVSPHHYGHCHFAHSLIPVDSNPNSASKLTNPIKTINEIARRCIVAVALE